MLPQYFYDSGGKGQKYKHVQLSHGIKAYWPTLVNLLIFKSHVANSIN
jgi:hypothetical protein